MWSRRRGPRAHPEPWSRQRLLGMLIGAAAATTALITGLGFAAVYAFTAAVTPTPSTSMPAASAAPADVRDRIAAAPMASVDPRAGYTPESAAGQPATIAIPLPADDDLGEAEVPVGFPHTTTGAIGQWAAIERRVVEAMDLRVAGQVHAAWVQPGGPTVEQWDLTRNVQEFLVAARQGGVVKDASTLVSATPVGAMVKGVDGPDWVLVCVLLDVRAVVSIEARMGYGLCSRMVWVRDRWMVAPGAQPATAPSAWPGSATASRVGWLAWTDQVGAR